MLTPSHQWEAVWSGHPPSRAQAAGPWASLPGPLMPPHHSERWAVCTACLSHNLVSHQTLSPFVSESQAEVTCGVSQDKAVAECEATPGLQSSAFAPHSSQPPQGTCAHTLPCLSPRTTRPGSEQHCPPQQGSCLRPALSSLQSLTHPEQPSRCPLLTATLSKSTYMHTEACACWSAH